MELQLARSNDTESPQDPSVRFADAVRACNAGQTDAAEALCQALLEAEPAHADGLHLSGVLALRSGQPALAVERIARSIALQPGNAEAHLNLAAALRLLGRRDEALAACREAVALAPGRFDAHYRLGLALRELRRWDEALPAYARCIELQPSNADAYNNLGVTLKTLGRAAEAVAAYRKAIELAPGLAETHYNLGIALSELDDAPQAEKAFARAVELRPDFAVAFNNLGVALLAQGRLEASARACGRAIELQPDFAGAYCSLGMVMQEAGLNDEALALYDRAAAFHLPGNDGPLGSKAQLLMELGRTEEAGAAAAQALAVNPRSGAAWLTRSELKRFEAGDPEIRAMEDLLAGADGSGMRAGDRINLEFALGKAWLDAGDPASAFAHFDEGNWRKRATFSYDAQAESRRLADIAAAFTPALIERLRGAGDRSELPIFVLGMPRSGTTLIEQILASHPQVHGAGELPLLQDLIDRSFPAAYPAGLQDLVPGDLARLGRDYAARASTRAAGRSRVVDKMLTNFAHAGLIHLILPEARIIHCRRDPVDTCLSCYTKNFRSGLRFCFDQRELGAMYRDYEGLMQHWRALLPADRFLEVDYEAVVDDLAPQARRLVEFCGVEWDDACLSFHATRRQVRTASANQVRQPIYRNSIGRWQRCARYLEPLLEALGR